MSTSSSELHLLLSLLRASSSSWISSKSLVILLVVTSIDFSRIRMHLDLEQNFQNEIIPLVLPPKSALFHYQPKALHDYRPIPFQQEWMNDFNIAPHDEVLDFGPRHSIIAPPQNLSVPEFLKVYHLSSLITTNLQELGREARRIIDKRLPQTGAILFRNLHSQINNASDFATFWNHVVQGSGFGTTAPWNPMTDHLSCYNRKRQRPAEGVDRVDTDVPSFTIGCHNEHSCNPRPSDRIFFYALHPAAQGGESLLRRNRDIVVPEKARQLVQDAGGLQFTRSYPTQQQLLSSQLHRHPTEMSWQERTSTQNHSLAKEYFGVKHGIVNVTFDGQDMLTAHTVLPGFLHVQGQEQQWFNRIDYGFPVELANGTIFPLDWQSQLKRQKWHETSAIKLQQGDWLVLDNLRVQHGRLPYRDVEGHPTRQLLVTYTSP
jgi:Taurine catabolism dioxygenase TauD, TfdA family